MISSINGEIMDQWVLTKPANFKLNATARSAALSSFEPNVSVGSNWLDSYGIDGGVFSNVSLLSWFHDLAAQVAQTTKGAAFCSLGHAGSSQCLRCMQLALASVVQYSTAHGCTQSFLVHETGESNVVDLGPD